MKATNYSMEDDRGVVSLMFQLVYAALMPSAREAWDGPVSAPKPGLFERFDRWASEARQRDRDRFLAESTDVFDLERREKALARRPYF
jgi:hypothetical protein